MCHRRTVLYFVAFLLTMFIIFQNRAPRFKYMTDAWVMNVFRDCPVDFPSVGRPWDPTGIRCPNASLTYAVKQAVRRGDIWMHAFPFNAQAELMNKAMFTAAINTTLATAAEMGSPHRPQVLSQRDVPGLTRGVVPHLRDRGIIGITIGSNDESPAPVTPSTVECDTEGKHVVRTPFLWVDKGSGASIIIDIHPGGYGGITGDYTPPGDSMDGSLCDCTGVHGLREVLCYAWRGDNYGPAQADEVEQDFQLFGALFPNATISASTLGDFFNLIERNATIRAALPVLNSEVGDTWMYGCASDPLKLAKMRALQRAFSECHEAGMCSVEQEPGIKQFVHYASKLFEHTWGGSTSHHMNVSRTEVEHIWSAEQLSAAQMNGTYKFIEKMQASWDEQRLFIDKAVSALEYSSEGSQKPTAAPSLAANIRRSFGELTAAAPTEAQLIDSNFTIIPKHLWAEPIDLGRITVAFDPSTGALVQLDSANSTEGSGWAAKSNPIGRFGYRAHSWQEWDAFIKNYTYSHGGQYPHQLPRPSYLTCVQMNNCTTVAMLWHAQIVGLWHRGTTAVVKLKLPDEPAKAGYGPPQIIFLTVSELPPSQGMVDVDIVWDDKLPTRLYESIYFDMHPTLPRKQPDNGNLTMGKWNLLVDKLGTQVDAADVVPHGGSAIHGMDPAGGVTFVPPPSERATQPSLHVKSLDAGLMMPAAARSVLNFTAFYQQPAVAEDGVSFNLLNNIYWTNYVLWYPWERKDALARFRFRVSTR